MSGLVDVIGDADPTLDPVMEIHPLRAAIYARYSSDAQREASIEDQVRLCSERLGKEGWELTQVFSDRAMSGASTLRAGYQELLGAIQLSKVDVIIAEALDRLSRDQEDVAALFKKAKFAGVKLITLAEGEITELHVGLKGTMNALFLKDLALKTHRGLRGRVEAGKSAGGKAFGYEMARRHDERGEVIRGDRQINEVEAAIVRRIFEMFASGSSPIAIAKALNAEHVPGPSSQAWRDTTIRGHAERGTGILRNETYIGRIVWNRMRFIKDPATGKRVSRLNPMTAWVIDDQPDLRIVDDELWQRVQSRLGAIREKSGANDASRTRFWEKRRSRHVLSDKVVCGCCGRPMTNVGKDYLACTGARKQGTCANGRSIKRGQLEALILDGLRERLMSPELVAEFVRDFQVEWNRVTGEQSAGRAAQERELVAVEKKLTKLIEAITDGFRGVGLQQTMDELESRKARLTAALAAPPPKAPLMHPNLAALYKERVANLHEAIRADDTGSEALELVRGLIEQVSVKPAAEGGGMEIELTGDIAAMVALASGAAPVRRVVGSDPDLCACSVKVVAGAGFEPATFRL